MKMSRFLSARLSARSGTGAEVVGLAITLDKVAERIPCRSRFLIARRSMFIAHRNRHAKSMQRVLPVNHGIDITMSLDAWIRPIFPKKRRVGEEWTKTTKQRLPS